MQAQFVFGDVRHRLISPTTSLVRALLNAMREFVSVDLPSSRLQIRKGLVLSRKERSRDVAVPPDGLTALRLEFHEN